MVRRLLYSWIVNVAAIWVASAFVDGIDYSEDYWVLIVTGLVFGLVNFLIKPIVKLLALPLIVITLGHHPLLHQPLHALHHELDRARASRSARSCRGSGQR